MALELVDHDPNARPRCFRNAFEEYGFVFTVMMATASTTFLQGVIIINTATIQRDQARMNKNYSRDQSESDRILWFIQI